MSSQNVLLSRMHPLCYRMRYDTCVVILNKKVFPRLFLVIFYFHFYQFLNYPLLINKYPLHNNMAPHGKELTKKQKEINVQLSNSGFSIYKIDWMTGINNSTVQKFLKRVREMGNVLNLPGGGSRRKTSPRDERILYRSIKSNRRQTVTSRFNACVTMCQPELRVNNYLKMAINGV